jgi:ABC-type microcin C transport system permease subunit YejB
MSFGGSVSAMITSLKNNRQLLTSLRNRRRYAMQHHTEPKKFQKSKDRKAIDPKLLKKLRQKIK